MTQNNWTTSAWTLKLYLQGELEAEMEGELESSSPEETVEMAEDMVISFFEQCTEGRGYFKNPLSLLEQEEVLEWIANALVDGHAELEFGSMSAEISSNYSKLVDF